MNSKTTQNDAVDDYNSMDLAFSKKGCCFWVPCIKSNNRRFTVGSTWWQRIKSTTVDSPPTEQLGDIDHWWTRGWKKLREKSEIFAGPKWKTFIRRFKKKKHGGRKFNYDPISYSLNFDEGPGNLGLIEDDDNTLSRAFSVRYAAVSIPPSSAKSSMDLRKGDSVPSFI